MAALNALKKQHNWTLVILNHVPKMFSGAVPLSLSAIQGSAKINQLIDDAIGLGQSHKDPSMVYVKQCKWRNGEIALDSGNVALYETVSPGQVTAGDSSRVRHISKQGVTVAEAIDLMQLFILFTLFSYA